MFKEVVNNSLEYNVRCVEKELLYYSLQFPRLTIFKKLFNYTLNASIKILNDFINCQIIVKNIVILQY